MKLSFMDDWLLNADVRVNLGESGVEDIPLSSIVSDEWLSTYSQQKLDNSDTHGSILLRTEIAKTYESVRVENVLVTAGTSEAILLLFLSKKHMGGNVVVTEPVFHNLCDVPESLGFEVRTVQLRLEEDFKLPVQRLLERVDDRTRAIIVNTPHNPTGVIYAPSDIDDLIKGSDGVGCDIIVDEHYRYLPLDVSRSFVASVALASDRIVVLGSPGKCFGCVGLRLGWIVASEGKIAEYHAWKTLMTHCVSTLSDSVGTAVMRNREKLLKRSRDMVLGNLTVLEEVAHEVAGALSVTRPEAGAVAFPALVGAETSLRFCSELREKKSVLVLPGEAFKSPKNFRIRLGAPKAAFAEAAEAMCEILREGRY